MITTIQSNYKNNYNAFQLSLSLDLGIKINSNDEVISFLKALEGVNLCRYLKKSERRGRKGYDHVMLLKVVLFARMSGFSDLRSLESLCRHDINQNIGNLMHINKSIQYIDDTKIKATSYQKWRKMFFLCKKQEKRKEAE